jgi:hypothetical protein
MPRLWSVACHLQRVGGEVFKNRQRLLIQLFRTRQVATINSHIPQIVERGCHIQRVGGEFSFIANAC